MAVLVNFPVASRVDFLCVQNFLKFTVGQMLYADKIVARPFNRADQFVKLGLYRRAIAVLLVLNEENHQECNDGRAGIDHQLPCIRKMEYRAGRRPNQNDKTAKDKCDGLARIACHPVGKVRECV